MSKDNITLDLTIGAVQNAKSYLRVNIHSDQNERGRIASVCGCHPETGSVVVRVSNDATEESLAPIFQALTESTLADLQSQGKVQEFPEGTHKWIKISLDTIAGGKVSEQVVPILSDNENLSGSFTLAIESDADASHILQYKSQQKSAVYAFLKSLRIHATTNFSHAQLKAISEVIGGITGIELEKYASFFSTTINAKIAFDSYEDVPADLISDVLDIERSPIEKSINHMLNSPLVLVGQGVEAHVFLTDAISAKIEANFPGLADLK